MSNLDSDPVRVVLVTGALGGIGRAICKLYHDQAYYVVGLDLAESGGDLGSDSDGDSGVIDRYIRVDLAHDEYYFGQMIDENVFEQFDRSLGQGQWNLDVVIHCAAYQVCNKIESLGAGDFSDTMSVNVLSVFRLNQELVHYLKRSQGSIVVVGSVHTVASSEGMAMYAISKCALEGLVRNTAIEWAKHGIRINMVSPGAVDTPMLRRGLAGRAGVNLYDSDVDFDSREVQDLVESELWELENRHPNKTIAEPSEVASIVYFLGDRSASGLINGQNIVADGGVSCVLSTEIS